MAVHAEGRALVVTLHPCLWVPPLWWKVEGGGKHVERDVQVFAELDNCIQWLCNSCIFIVQQCSCWIEVILSSSFRAIHPLRIGLTQSMFNVLVTKGINKYKDVSWLENTLLCPLVYTHFVRLFGLGSCLLFIVGLILDDKLNGKLKPWKSVLSIHNVCLPVCLSVCLSVNGVHGTPSEAGT